ncbi:MAG: isoprenylcysteine carboxylmethyltransferase family protein [Acidobacteria bacterium]|nr:MAG: isoprenylcysteine carboxylmethyltransferase family protein [Acidobacteriota bacterium]
MIEPLIVTVLPVLFLILLFGGGALLRRRGIDVDGTPPIDRRPYYFSKYSILLVWAAMVIHTWGIDLSLVKIPSAIRWLSLGLWVSGFILLLVGRLGLGDSFRIGSAKEGTNLRVNGLFCLSRNPMYVGMFATLIASGLYCANPILLVLAVLIIAVHHAIVRAEERHLRDVFGQDYEAYCQRVRRYV